MTDEQEPVGDFENGYGNELTFGSLEWRDRANAYALNTSLFLRVLYMRLDKVSDIAESASPMMQAMSL